MCSKFFSIFTQKLTVYREYYSRDFKTYTYSIANLANIAIWLLIIVMPLDLILQNQGKCSSKVDKVELLWTKKAAYTEQAQFNYNGKLFGEFVFADVS